jgi:hypothetical protein
MAGGQIFEEPKKGFLARLFGGTKRIDASVRRREQLSLTVPADKADVVRAAVAHWLEGHGVTTAVTSAEAENGKVRIRAKLADADAAKIDFSADDVQSELQDVLADALT